MSYHTSIYAKMNCILWPEHVFKMSQISNHIFSKIAKITGQLLFWSSKQNGNIGESYNNCIVIKLLNCDYFKKCTR